MTQPATEALSCAVGIATYKRPDILAECLHCLAGQTRLPQEILIADASPDAGAARERVRRDLPGLADRTRLVHLESPAGLPLQRNQILDQARSDVILFLDDDAFAAPEYVERMMAVYEADPEGRGGGG